MDETLEASARRELAEETGLEPDRLLQLHTFGDPGRDPRGRVVTVAFLAMVRRVEHAPRAASDAARVGWFDLARPPRLAFDHDRILATAREALRDLARLRPCGLELLPATFTLAELGGLYEVVLGRRPHRDAIQSSLIDPGLIVTAGSGGDGTAVYTFDRQRYRVLERTGLEPAL
jgi:8-oxo-dGTP diphosphatase